MNERWEALRSVFDSVAEEYDEVRSGYPEELVASALTPFEAPSSIRILEIGCGTGQATRLFADHDCEILAIEPGTNLAAIAARNLSKKPRVSFENCRFEDWKLEVASFDLVLAAVSIYWVDATVRYQKIADALKPEGYFASLWNEEWVSEDDVQEALTKVHFSVFDSSHPLYPKNKIPQEPHFFASEISECKLFSDVSIIEHPTWKTVRSKQDYIKFLLTKSGYAILPDEKKDELSSGIEEVLDRNGGQVEMTNVATLYLAQKRS